MYLTNSTIVCLISAVEEARNFPSDDGKVSCLGDSGDGVPSFRRLGDGCEGTVFPYCGGMVFPYCGRMASLCCGGMVDSVPLLRGNGVPLLRGDGIPLL